MDDSTSHTPPGSAEVRPNADDRPPPPTNYVLPRPPGHGQTPKIQPRPPELSAPDRQLSAHQHSHQPRRVTPPDHHAARRPRWLTGLVAVAFLLIPLALGGWLLVREDGSVASDSWPSNPDLKYSLEANGSTEDGTWILIDGTAEDLYVVDRGVRTSLVTHYVDGKAKWRSDVGYALPKRLDLIDDKMFVTSAEPNDDDPIFSQDNRIDRVDTETGEVMWTITAVGEPYLEIIENRLYVIKRVDAEDTNKALFEYDIDTGEELNKRSGRDAFFIEDKSFIEDGFLEVDENELTLGVVDLDFQPVGEPVSVEPSWVEGWPVIWSDYEDGWVYYSDRTGYGGVATAVGLSRTGEIQFECETVVDEPRFVSMRDRSTLLIWGFDEAEVLDVDGTGCTHRWNVEVDDESFLSIDQYAVITYYGGTVKTVEDDDAKISVLGWDTGQPIATGEGVFLFNDVGEWMTRQGQIMVARKVESGDELWQIATPNDATVWIAPGLVALVTKGSLTSTIDVYGD